MARPTGGQATLRHPLTLRDPFMLAPKGTSAVRLLESLLSKGVYVKLNFWSDRVDSQN